MIQWFLIKPGAVPFGQNACLWKQKKMPMLVNSLWELQKDDVLYDKKMRIERSDSIRVIHFTLVLFMRNKFWRLSIAYAVQ